MGLETFSLREITSRPMRALLTFLSIAIGVAAVVAVLLATSTTRAAQRDMFKAISGQADFEMISDGASGFPEDAVVKTRELTGVRLAAPSINRFGTIFSGDRKARTQVLGVDPRIDPEVRDYKVVAGRLPESLTEVLMDESFANSLAVSLDGTIKLLGRGGLKEFQVVGFVQPNASSAVALSSAVYMVLPAAQVSFGKRGFIDQIQVVVEEGADVPALMERVRQLLPEGVTVREPQTRSSMASETMFATENGLFMAIAFALLISIFIIYNTFQMSVGERRRQIGILRAVGATRRQIQSMILREALVISVFAAVAGCLLGVYGASWLNSATSRLLLVELPGVRISFWPFAIAVSSGIGVSLLGALLPARRAASVEPVEAMRAVEIRHNDEVISLTRRLGLWVLPFGGLLFVASLCQLLPTGGDIVAIVLMLLGCVLMIPQVLQPISTWLVRLISRFFGYESELAHKQLLRHVGRSTLTIGVLFIAMATTVGLAGNIMDNVDNVRGWYSRAFVGDFFIRASLPDLATGTAADLPEEVGDRIRNTPGVKTVDSMRFTHVQAGDDSVLLVVRDFKGEVGDFFDLVEGSAEQALLGLRAGKAVIGTVLAKRRGLELGSQLAIETPNGTRNIEVAAIANDYYGGGLTVYLDRATASELLHVEGVDAYIIKSFPGQIDEVENSLQQLSQEEGLIFQSYADLVRYIDGIVNGVIASLWGLLALGCVIAAIGLVNTLTMNILEQTREIGLLRVVAMTRSQVQRMIFSQALLIGLIGLVPGVIAGGIVEYLISFSSYAVLGHHIAAQFRPVLLFGSLGAGFLIVAASSMLPARRAATVKLSSALHYE